MNFTAIDFETANSSRGSACAVGLCTVEDGQVTRCDQRLIRRSLDDAGIEYPDLNYYCTCVMAKQAWPGMPTYGLDHMARHLGLAFQHHNAAEDARACAVVALEACRLQDVRSLSDMEPAFGVAAGRQAVVPKIAMERMM